MRDPHLHTQWRCPHCQHEVEASALSVGARCPRGCPYVMIEPVLQGRHPSDPWLGRLIADRYAVVDILTGVGGPGHVYRALQRPRDQAVEIRLIARGSPTVDDPFFRMAGRVAALNHPALQTLIDYGETLDGASYLVHQLIEGPTLLEQMQLGGPLSPQRTVEIALAILDGLRPGHLGGMDHRDLKPSNVVMQGDEIRVKGFGVMAILERCAHNEGPGPVLGTPSYMAPERLLDRRTDASADVYALGVMMYRMLTGRLPFTGRDNTEILAHQIQTLPPAIGVPLSPTLESLVLKAMAKRPEDRFATALEMRLALQATRALMCEDLTSEDQEPATQVIEVEPQLHHLPMDDQPTRALAPAGHDLHAPALAADLVTLTDGDSISLPSLSLSEDQPTAALLSRRPSPAPVHLDDEATQVTEIDDVSRWVGLMEAHRTTPPRLPSQSSAASLMQRATAPQPALEPEESGLKRRWRLPWMYGALAIGGVILFTAALQWRPGY